MPSVIRIFLSILIVLGSSCRARTGGDPPANTSAPLLQSTRTTCGPAALSMLLAARGQFVAESTLTRRMRPGQYGVSLSSIITTAQAYNVSLAAWRLRFDTLGSIATPAILWVDGDHFVVFDSIGTSGVHLRDPSAGRIVVPLERFRDRWDGTAAVLRASS